MKTIGFKAKWLPFVSSLFLMASALSYAVLESQAGTASKTKGHKPPSGKLDGKIYIVQLLEPGKSPISDSLIFRWGTFRSTAYMAYGFGKGNYKTLWFDNSTTFSSKTASDSEGTMLWKGSVQNNQIQGTVVWAKKNQEKPLELTFSGSLAEPQAKIIINPK